ncbi:RNA-binding protein [candidate division KSB1 bacterium]|nr:RNA-binding protein [candidate division KSB1 bacterium]
MNIYVGNLPKSTDEETVRQLFEEHGEVTEVKLIKDHFTGELKGFGFITMPAKAEAEAAMEAINEHELAGNTLIVNEARPRKGGGKRRPGGGSGGRRGGGGQRRNSW